MTHDLEVDAPAEQLEAAGLLTVTTDPDGSVRYTLTPDGERVARGLAMAGEGADEVLEGLLGDKR